MLSLSFVKTRQIKVISRIYYKSETFRPSFTSKTLSPEKSLSKLVSFSSTLVNIVFGYIISICSLQNTIFGLIILLIDSPSDESSIKICDS